MEITTKLMNALKDEIALTEYAIENGYYKSAAGHCESTKLDLDDIDFQKEALSVYNKALNCDIESLNILAEGKYCNTNIAMLAGEFVYDNNL